MNDSPRKSQFTPGVGSSSVVVIFLLLCLVTFSALSLVSANADMTLTKKALTQSQAYYQAENNAQEHLAQLDALLEIAYQNGVSEAGYFQLVTEQLKQYPLYHPVIGEPYQIFFIEEIDSTQNLLVGLELHYPQSSQPLYNIIQWESQTAQEWNPQENITLLRLS